MTVTPISFQAETQLPTEFGRFRFLVYHNARGQDVVAVVSPELELNRPVPVRLHSACFTAEVMASLKCDCKQQLDYALEYIAKHGGVVVYLPQEGRGIGLANKIRAYALQEDGHDTIEANRLLDLPVDGREYQDAAAVLNSLDIQQIKLITNNPEKLSAIAALGFTVVERISVPVISNRYSHAYLETKRQQMGHLLAPAANRRFVASHGAPQKRKRPFVHVNFALSPDGQMNQVNGDALTLSCAADWQRVHELRERYTAVAVGAKTWVQDRPRLSARREHLGRDPVRQPYRVVFAGRTYCEFSNDERRNFVIGSAQYRDRPVTHIPADDYDLNAPLSALYRNGVESLLVEGGMTLLQSFVAQNMVDRFTVYVATHCADIAQAAVGKALPDLALPLVSALPLGRGILLSYQNTAVEQQSYAVDQKLPFGSGVIMSASDQKNTANTDFG